MLHRITLTIIAGLAVLPHAAHAEVSSSRVTASVPESCRLDAPNLSLNEGSESATGVAWEMCNSGRGYRIAALTRALDSSETIVLRYGNLIRELNAVGQTDLVNRSGPIFKQVPMSLNAKDLNRPLVLSVSMTAI
ncbi:hypothetical protein [uncultured Erythrobacter sp.]|uniref:hypothetical protein n=1 Tax=uncultured Erythrobacter sp. TaxID=263913 RepID=UPI00262E385D|nr:hypothetical protein [uncultured Erythrobacter sp.]